MLGHRCGTTVCVCTLFFAPVYLSAPLPTRSSNLQCAPAWPGLLDWGCAGSKRVKLPKSEWVLESGCALEPSRHPPLSAASTANGVLTIRNQGSHCVLWANRPFPQHVELRFGVRPQNNSAGLNIVFFSASGLPDGGSIFALNLPPRHGNYSKWVHDWPPLLPLQITMCMRSLRRLLYCDDAATLHTCCTCMHRYTCNKCDQGQIPSIATYSDSYEIAPLLTRTLIIITHS